MFDKIGSTLSNLNRLLVIVLRLDLGAHGQVVREGLGGHIAVEGLFPVTLILNRLALLGLHHHGQGECLAALFGFHAHAGELSSSDRLAIDPKQFVLGADGAGQSWNEFIHVVPFCLGLWILSTNWLPKVGGLILTRVSILPQLLLHGSFHRVVQFLALLCSLQGGTTLDLGRSCCSAAPVAVVAVLDHPSLARVLDPTFSHLRFHVASRALMVSSESLRCVRVAAIPGKRARTALSFHSEGRRSPLVAHHK